MDWDWPGCPLWNYGIWLILFLEAWLRLQTERDYMLILKVVAKFSREDQRAEEYWFVFRQTSQSSHQEALLYVFEDNEAVIEMIIMGRSPTMRDVSRTQSCAWLIVRSIQLIWTPKSKSSTSTPKTNSLASKPTEISHVMSEIICCARSILVISVLLCALTQCRNDVNKIQEENESQHNRNRWWISLSGRRRSCRLQ